VSGRGMEAPGRDYGSGATVGLGDAPLALGLQELLVGRRECKLSVKKLSRMWASFYLVEYVGLPDEYVTASSDG